MGDGDDVRCPGGLDDPAGACAPGHDVVRARGDVLVELAEDEPARHRAPERRAGRRLREGRLRDGPLRRSHEPGPLLRDVGGELRVVLVRVDLACSRAITASQLKDSAYAPWARTMVGFINSPRS